MPAVTPKSVPNDSELLELAHRVGDALRGRGWMLTTAESCTGGWIGQIVTAAAGSSQWYERGFVTYSNLAKQEQLGVSVTTLSRRGAVSEATARAMAEGALKHSRAQVAVAVTGIAGPGGGTSEKPVGTVWIAWAAKNRDSASRCHHFRGERDSIRRQSVAAALAGLIEFVG